jgi:perosamine synthetase
MFRPIAIGLSPNSRFSDVLLAARLLFMPWRYKRGSSIQRLELWFRQFFNVSHAISFISGRGALYAILKSLGIGQNDEVIIPAFTCVVVPNAVIATGAKPIYIDITNSLTMDTEDIERHITSKTKAIIVQHTFGIPNDMQTITAIAKKHKLFIVEDVAHTIGGKDSNQKKLLGTFGIASIFSFGRDKALSSVFGGIVITSDEELGKKIRQFQRAQTYPSFRFVFQQLFHPVAFFIILPLYRIYIGKALLVLLQKLHLLSFPVIAKEKKGRADPMYIKKMPNALAALAVSQLHRLEEYNQNRVELSTLYAEELEEFRLDQNNNEIPYLRFPIFVTNRDEVLQKLKSKGMYLGNWYSHVIDPKGTSFEQIFYTRGSCPKAEYIAKIIINLPTYQSVSRNDAKKIVTLITKYAKND